MSLNPKGMDYRLRKWALMAALLFNRQQRALQLLDDMIGRWPDDAYARASRSHLHAQAGRTTAALADARALVTAHPQRSAGDWFNLAFLLESADQLDEAEAAFRRAVDIDPELDRAWYGLGLTLIRLGRPDDAVKALERNTKLQPMSPYGWYQLARVQLDRQQPDEALRIIRHLKGFEPKVAAQLERETGLQA